MTDVSIPMAFLAGVLSFLSPCVLPLVPSYVSFITGISFEELTGADNRREIRAITIKNSLTFIAGFSVVFIALGASSSYLGQLLFEYQEWIQRIGGVLIIIFGLFIAGLLKIDFFMKEKKFQLSGKPAGYVGTFVIGMTFAAGWTPCIGPILGTILLYASTEGSTQGGMLLLAVYSFGLALPFFFSSLAINSFLSYSKSAYRYMRVIMAISGILLIGFGLILLTDKLGLLTSYFPDLGISL